MKVTQTTRTSDDHGNDSYLELEIISDNGETASVSFGEGEPEDMVLWRDLSDVYDLVELVQLAYDAGKRGEEIEFIYKDNEDE